MSTLTVARPRTDYDRCTTLVERLAEATGEAWTFGYIGNCGTGPYSFDDRSWFAFRPHPGRVGTHKDCIGGVPTAELDRLALKLTGILEYLDVIS